MTTSKRPCDWAFCDYLLARWNCWWLV